MRNRRSIGARAVVLTLSAAIATLGIAAAQDPSPKTASKVAVPKGKVKKGGLLAPGGAKGKALRKAAHDPLAGAEAVGKAATAAPPAPGTFHYALKIVAADGTPLASTFYPSRLGTGAAVVILVHERDRSSKDFEEKVADLQGKGLAEYLQKQGYAVLAIDLRGQGANVRRTLNQKDWRMMVGDLQSAYLFLVDRHNRGEINLSRLGMVALGEGANLAAVWASLPGGAVSSQGRTTDLGGLVLISPMIDAQSQGLRAQQPITTLAPRIPLCLLVGERDAASADLVKAAKAAVTRVRSNKVELFPSSLHGFKLLRLEPNVTTTITRFFDETIKAKAEEWEPRYNMDPITYTGVRMIPNTSQTPADTPKAAEAATKKDEAK